MDVFVQISDLPASSGLAVNMCAYHSLLNHVGVIRNKLAEAEK
jgi:hypothetical protein